jgi:hypothetical protein
MRKSSRPRGRKTTSGEREIRKAAIQEQIDIVMDSFDFGAALGRIAPVGDGIAVEERTLRRTARKVLMGAATAGGWVTGGGFAAILQEWRSQPGRGAVKISLFHGPNSLLEPHTEFSDDEIRTIEP